MNTIAIVVTYNRKVLLEKCIQALLQQTLAISNIVIIDNASTDGTADWFNQSDYCTKAGLIYKKLPVNLGGAGGFNVGLKYALDEGFDWAWIMDDDAEPENIAFEELLKHASDTNNIYGSIAIQEDKTSWDTTLLFKSKKFTTDRLSDIPDLGEVSFLPFLGLLISTVLIKKIGLPETEFFIAGDDLEYCLRAKASGAKIFVSGKSRIQHPKANIINIRFFSFNIKYLKVPPWKNYYNVRNKLLIAKKYHPSDLILKTLPGIIVRIIFDFIFCEQKFIHMYSSFAGIYDGFSNTKGDRHIWWKIPQ